MVADCRTRSLRGLSADGFHRLAYREWGAPDASHTVVCLHGLARNSRDFDDLAAALAKEGLRIVCPDIVGRGDSGYLRDPMGYGYPQYLADFNALLARLDVEQVDVVGTSMGGLIGMMAAALPDHPLRRLVINDVGPFIPKRALERIVGYVGDPPIFRDKAQAEAWLRETYAAFGLVADAQWRRFTEISVEPCDGGCRPRYDPAIGVPLTKTPLEDIDLWSLWDAVSCEVLVLRGARSDLLSAETASDMTRRGPRARLVEFGGCGHAPALQDAEQIAVVRDWLTGP